MFNKIFNKNLNLLLLAWLKVIIIFFYIKIDIEQIKKICGINKDFSTSFYICYCKCMTSKNKQYIM